MRSYLWPLQPEQERARLSRVAAPPRTVGTTCSTANGSVVTASGQRQYSHRRAARCSTAWRSRRGMRSANGRRLEAELSHQFREADLTQLRQLGQGFQPLYSKGLGFLYQTQH